MDTELQEMLMKNFQNYDSALKTHDDKFGEMQGAIERINQSIGGYEPSLNNYSQVAVSNKGDQKIAITESLADVVFDTLSLANVNLFRTCLFLPQINFTVPGNSTAKLWFLHTSRSLFHGAEAQFGGDIMNQYAWLGHGLHATNDLHFPLDKKLNSKLSVFGGRQNCTPGVNDSQFDDIQLCPNNNIVQGAISYQNNGGFHQNQSSFSGGTLFEGSHKLCSKMMYLGYSPPGTAYTNDRTFTLSNVMIPLWYIFDNSSLFKLDRDINVKQLSLKLVTETIQNLVSYSDVVTNNTNKIVTRTETTGVNYFPDGYQATGTVGPRLIPANNSLITMQIKNMRLLYATNQGVPPAPSMLQVPVIHNMYYVQTQTSVVIPINPAFKHLRSIVITTLASQQNARTHFNRQDIMPIGTSNFDLNGPINDIIVGDAQQGLGGDSNIPTNLSTMLLQTSQIQYMNQVPYFGNSGSYQFSQFYEQQMKQYTGVSMQCYLANNSSLLIDYTTPNNQVGIEISQRVSDLIFNYQSSNYFDGSPITDTIFVKVSYTRLAQCIDGIWNYVY